MQRGRGQDEGEEKAGIGARVGASFEPETSSASLSGGFHDHHSPSLPGGTDLRSATAGDAPWFAETILIAQYLRPHGLLEAITRQVCLVRGRFGRYESIDFLALLFGYAISGERKLRVYFERLAPFAALLMALPPRLPPLPRTPRATRAHRRLSWDARLGRNARVLLRLATMHVVDVPPALLEVLSEQSVSATS